jgi:AraC-like DNA-binding protein
MAKGHINGSQANTSSQKSETNQGVSATSGRLQGLDSNPQGQFGPQLWEMFRIAVGHLYTVSLPDPSEEARFTLATRTYATPQAVLMWCRGTAFTMTRGPDLIARGADQIILHLLIEVSVVKEHAGRRVRREAGDIEIIDYARPLQCTATDYEVLIVHLTRKNLPATLLALEPHGVIFRRGTAAARLIGAAMQEFYAQADYLTVSEAEAVIEGIVALMTAFAHTRLAGGEADRVKSRKRAALDYIDAHLGNTELGPDEIADAVNLSRASLYRLMVSEGGIRAVLLKRRLDAALRLMLETDKDDRSLKEIVNRCGFSGKSQFSRAFRARFGVPPRQYRALLRRQDLGWQEARLTADGFEGDTFLWRQLGLRSNRRESP